MAFVQIAPGSGRAAEARAGGQLVDAEAGCRRLLLENEEPARIASVTARLRGRQREAEEHQVGIERAAEQRLERLVSQLAWLARARRPPRRAARVHHGPGIAAQ